MIHFEGKYINGIRNGKEYYSNGKLKFEGNRNGKGIEYYYNNSEDKEYEILFKGVYKNNYRWNGKGKEINIKEGNGKGVEFNKNGKLIFKGEYKDGKKWREFYDDEGKKVKFEGEYKDGKKWKGKMYNKLGNLIFEGEIFEIYKGNCKWWNGYEYKDNKICNNYINGEKKDNNFDINNWKDGIIFNNNNNNGSGFGKEYNNNELVFKGEFKDNKRIKGKEYNNKNLIFEGEYKNNIKWKGKIFNNLKEFDGEIRNEKKKFYIYIPFIRNKKDYRINKLIINDNNENIYYGSTFDEEKNLLIREIPKYKYNIELIKKYFEIYKLLISEIKFETIFELFYYKDNFYIVVEIFKRNLKNFIDEFKVKLPNELIYQIIIIFYNIIKFFDEKKLIFNFLNPKNFLYNEKRENKNFILNFNYFLDKCLYVFKEPQLLIKNNKIYDYNAPELYISENKNITNKINVWSLGILIYEMLFHQYPEINYIKQLNENDILSNLIIKMLEIEPEKRISYNYIIEIPFLKQIFNDKNKDVDLKLKIVLLGADTNVGCNSIINSFIYNIPYLGTYIAMGPDYKIKIIYKNNLKIQLYVWYSSGQDRFWSIIPNYLKQKEIILIFVYNNEEYTIDKLIYRYNLIKGNDLLYMQK